MKGTITVRVPPRGTVDCTKALGHWWWSKLSEDEIVNQSDRQDEKENGNASQPLGKGLFSCHSFHGKIIINLSGFVTRGRTPIALRSCGGRTPLSVANFSPALDGVRKYVGFSQAIAVSRYVL